jgi:RnfABCDGE-type electron transport complex B subunit
MNFVTIGLSAGTLLGMAVVFSYVLGWASKAFHVEVDPRVEAIIEALPGANCGGCGYVGCSDYAEAVVFSNATVSLCTVGGESCARAVADIMGVEVGESYPYRPIVHCGAHLNDKLKRTEYRGEKRCLTVNLVANVQGCTYGCLGYGDCERACEFDAIHVVDGLATVDYDKCVGCGACSRVCPRNIISMAPFKAERIMAVTCSNKDSGKDVMSVCEVGCIGCKKCARVCSLIKIEEGISTIDYEAYGTECPPDLMEACEKCPRSRLVFVGKPSEKDRAKVADEELPEVVEPDFKTTVDDTEWWG